jgi:hypothetical protein
MPRFLPFILLCLIAWDRAQACTKEFKPVCGYWMHSPRTQTFPNRCVMNKAGAVFSSDGECNPPPLSKDVTLIVAPQDIACMGVGPMRCLQVKVGDAKNWSAHYENIEGFTFIPGFEYTLWVRITWIAKPPADGSSARFTLLRELSRTPSD